MATHSFSCLGDSTDKRAWQAPWGPKESDTTEHTHSHYLGQETEYFHAQKLLQAFIKFLPPNFPSNVTITWP